MIKTNNLSTLKTLALVIGLGLISPTIYAEITPVPEHPGYQNTVAQTSAEHSAAEQHHSKQAEYHRSMAEHHKSLSAEHKQQKHQKLAKHHEKIAEHHNALAKEHEATGKIHKGQAVGKQ